ncbi:MAG: hypothetical protein ACT4NL_18755 [Pseudomarimonas sp.]
MGLLDELEEEAQRRRAEEEQRRTELSAREAQWNERIEPAMRELERYLTQLTEQLTYLKKSARVVYNVVGYGDVVAYVEPVYTLVGRAPNKTSYEIALSFSAIIASDECPLLQGETGTRLKSLISVLQQLRISGLSDVRKNPNGEIIAARIQAKGKIPLALTASADQESGAIRLLFTNFEGLGQSSRNFRVEQLDTAFCDALGRFIARDELNFAQEAVDEDLRRLLKTRLQRDSIKREWETKLSRQLAADESKALDSLDPSLRPGSLVGRIKLFSKRLIGR